MIKLIIKKICDVINAKLHHLDCYIKYRCSVSESEYIKNVNISEGKNIYFMMIPNYGNIGDQIITLASLNYLEKYWAEYNIVKIPLDKTYIWLKRVKEKIKAEDMIFLQGGGNLGNRYTFIEDCRRFICKHLKHNPIISMPLSFAFTNDSWGNREIKRSSKIYSKHPNMLFLVRDTNSYQKMKNCFPDCKILLTPDIAFFYKSENSIFERNKSQILIALRHDNESNCSDIVDENVSFIKNNLENTIVLDTIVARNISEELRKIEVESFLDILSTATLLVTDRMHGLIMAWLTNTPCIAIETKDGKMQGVFEVIQNTKGITLADSIDENLIKFIKNYGCEFDKAKDEEILVKKFADLKKEILELIKK